jgi:hypothetical protein
MVLRREVGEGVKDPGGGGFSWFLPNISVGRQKCVRTTYGMYVPTYSISWFFFRKMRQYLSVSIPHTNPSKVWEKR